MVIIIYTAYSKWSVNLPLLSWLHTKIATIVGALASAHITMNFWFRKWVKCCRVAGSSYSLVYSNHRPITGVNVVHILGSINAEWDKSQANATGKQTDHSKNYPGKHSTPILNSSCNLQFIQCNCNNRDNYASMSTTVISLPELHHWQWM